MKNAAFTHQNAGENYGWLA